MVPRKSRAQFLVELEKGLWRMIGLASSFDLRRSVEFVRMLCHRVTWGFMGLVMMEGGVWGLWGQ